MALAPRTLHTLASILVAIVLVVLSCRVTGSPDPQPGPLPGIDAGVIPIPPFGDGGQDDAMPQFDAPDDAPEPQLDARVT